MTPIEGILVCSLAAWIGIRVVSSAMAKKRIPGMLAAGAQVVDVRTAGEYKDGHAPYSINIPLDKLEQGLDRLDRERPLIVVCASGTRSGMAATMLRMRGFTHVLNGGPWRNLPPELPKAQ